MLDNDYDHKWHIKMVNLGIMHNQRKIDSDFETYSTTEQINITNSRLVPKFVNISKPLTLNLIGWHDKHQELWCSKAIGKRC